MLTKRREGKRVEECASGRQREGALWLFFLYMYFFLHLGLPYVNWASQECCLFYLKSSLPSSYLPLTFLCSIFTGFSLPCLLATTILDSYFLFYLPNSNNAPICETAKETQIWTDFWTLWDKMRMGWFERITLKHVYYYMWRRSPVQVRCMKQGTWSQCTGTTLRYEMGREVEWGFRMRDTCIPMAVSCQCMAKTNTIL